MTQGRGKTSKVRSAKAAARKPSGKKVVAASRKKSAANRAPKVSTASKRAASPPAVTKGAVSKGAVSKGAVSKGAVSKGAVSKGAVSKAASSKGTAKAVASKGTAKAVAAKGAANKRSVGKSAASKTKSSKAVAASQPDVKTSKSTTKLKPPPVRRPVQLGLGFDDRQDELAVLQQQNKRLLLKIGKRRASLHLLRQLSDELMQEASLRVVPYREELKELTRELLDLESQVLSAEKLVGRNRDHVRLVFHDLLKGLPQEELDEEPAAVAEPNTAGSSREANAYAGANSESNDTHERASLVDGASAETFSSRSVDPRVRAPADGAAPSQVNGPSAEAAQPEARSAEVAQPEARSADKPSGDQSGALRSLFKRLVIQWHPDRVRDDAEKAERTKLMKELTQAFEGGDLAKLVSLEQTLALKKASSQPVVESPEKRAEQLRRANAELLKQLAELQTSIEAVREDCPFTLDYRQKDPASGARDELDQFVLMNHMAVQRATETRDFVLSFAQGKLKLSDFLQGPRRSP